MADRGVPDVMGGSEAVKGSYDTFLDLDTGRGAGRYIDALGMATQEQVRRAILALKEKP